MTVVSVHDVDSRKAERMIEGYLIKQAGPHFASEIADALGLEYGVAFKIIHKLSEERRMTEEGDGIIGKRIVYIARKISRPRLVMKGGRRRELEGVLSDAEAYIDIAVQK
jgi:hypothetical protein